MITEIISIIMDKLAGIVLGLIGLLILYFVGELAWSLFIEMPIFWVSIFVIWFIYWWRKK